MLSTDLMIKSNLLTRAEWKNLPCVKTESGLFIGESTVVEYWEEPIQKKLAELSTKKRGKVLEVGFGLGLASKNIQRFGPKSHFIIEAHPELVKHAVQWHSKNDNVFVISAFWEEVIEHLNGGFDGIIFDTYPTDGSNFTGGKEETINLIIPFLHYSFSLLNPSGVICFIDFFGVDENQWLAIADEYKLIYKGRYLTKVEPPQNCHYASKSTSYIIKMTK